MTGLEPVNTVFGPFLRDPDESIAREVREAIEAGTWCEIHGRIEPGRYYMACLECGHAFPTPEALIADHAAVVERLNAHPLQDPFGPDDAKPIVPKTDPDEITACPHCAHDL